MVQANSVNLYIQGVAYKAAIGETLDEDNKQ